jgi:hypothetical protein
MAFANTKRVLLRRFARVFLLALIALLTAEAIAVRTPIKINRAERAVQLIRPVASIDAEPQPEAVEGQNLRFVVRLSRASAERVVVSYRIGNVEAIALSRIAPSVVIAAGEREAAIVIPTVDDDLLNGDRNIAVTLLGASGGVTLGNAQAVGIIRDNERPPVPTADIEAAPMPSVVEGGTLRFTLRLRAAVKARTTIRYQIIDPGEATAAGGKAALTIPAGATDVPLSIATRDDALVNGERSIRVRLTAISGDGKFGVAQVQGVVLDNDKASALPRFSILPNGNAVEGEELSFTVFADSAMRKGQRIPIRIDAPDASLIEPIAANVLLAAGQTSAVLTLLTADDAIMAAPRRIVVSLVGGDGILLDPAQISATALINDNDQTPVVSEGGSTGDAQEPPVVDPPAVEIANDWGAVLTKGPLPVIIGAVLLLIAGLWGAKHFILPRFYKVDWALGVPHAVSASSSGTASLLAPHGGVEIELGDFEASVIGPCPILSKEERDDPDDGN